MAVCYTVFHTGNRGGTRTVPVFIPTVVWYWYCTVPVPWYRTAVLRLQDYHWLDGSTTLIKTGQTTDQQQ